MLSGLIPANSFPKALLYPNHTAKFTPNQLTIDRILASWGDVVFNYVHHLSGGGPNRLRYYRSIYHCCFCYFCCCSCYCCRFLPLTWQAYLLLYPKVCWYYEPMCWCIDDGDERMNSWKETKHTTIRHNFHIEPIMFNFSKFRWGMTWRVELVKCQTNLTWKVGEHLPFWDIFWYCRK